VITEIRTILLAEDNPHDVALTIEALRENQLVNDVVVCRDGEPPPSHHVRPA
jgi:two-component system response regulator